MLAPYVDETFNKENVVNIYKQWKFNLTLKASCVSRKFGWVTDKWLSRTTDQAWRWSTITYFKNGKEASKEEYIFRNYAVIRLFGIYIFHGIILLFPLSYIQAKKQQQNPPETCHLKLFITGKPSRCPLVQALLTAMLTYTGTT